MEGRSSGGGHAVWSGCVGSVQRLHLTQQLPIPGFQDVTLHCESRR